MPHHGDMLFLHVACVQEKLGLTLNYPWDRK